MDNELDLLEDLDNSELDGASKEKSARAFRTISEVSEDLGVQPHTLRFWEEKFPDVVVPVKRSGDRRYYRPEDVQLLSKINFLLHDQKYSISGVQKLIEEGKLNSTVELLSNNDGVIPEKKASNENLPENFAELESLIQEITEISDILRKYA